MQNWFEQNAPKKANWFEQNAPKVSAAASLPPVKPATPPRAAPAEEEFQRWYKGWAAKAGIDPNPDSPQQKYDYRAAFRAGVEPEINAADGLYHWPSEFKADDHPNRFVDGVDTKTGKSIKRPLGASGEWDATPVADTEQSQLLNTVLGGANAVIDAAYTPMRAYQEEVQRQEDTKDAALSENDPLYAVKSGLGEARRRTLNVASDILLDPTNILPLGTLMKGARWGVRLAADALFVGMAETGALTALAEKRYDDAALQQAFALVGMAGASRGKKMEVLREAEKRSAARTDAQIATDLKAYEQWSQRNKKPPGDDAGGGTPDWFAENAPDADAGPMAINELPDGTVVGRMPKREIVTGPTAKIGESVVEQPANIRFEELPEVVPEAAKAAEVAVPEVRATDLSMPAPEIPGRGSVPLVETGPKIGPKPSTRVIPPKEYDALSAAAQSEMDLFVADVQSAQDLKRADQNAFKMETNADYGAETEWARIESAKRIKSFGVKERSPVQYFPEPPGKIKDAIVAKKGKLYERVEKAFLEDAKEQEQLRLAAEQEQPLIAEDATGISVDQPESTLKPFLGKTEAEAATIAARGRTTDVLKEQKAFDDTRLVESPLFQGRGGREGFLPTDERAAEAKVLEAGRLGEASEVGLEDADISFDFGEATLKYLDDVEARTKADIEQGWKDLAKGETLGAGLPTKLTSDLIKLGAVKIAKGTIQFTQWSAEMVAEFGDRVKPYLRDVYSQALQRAKVIRDTGATSTTRIEAMLTTGEDPVGKLVAAIKRAGTSRDKLEAAYTEERAKRAEKLDEIMAKAEGEKGFHQALGALKGEMAADKKSFESPKLEQADVDALFAEIQGWPTLNVWDKITASDGLRRILQGQIPPRSQLIFLEEIFGKEMVSAFNQKKPFWGKFGDIVTDVLSVPRSLMASFDMSAVLRQGVILTTTKPKAAVAAGREMFRQVFSEKNAEAWLDALPNDPMYKLMKDNDLYIVDNRKIAEGLAAREERFMSPMAERIPILGGMVRASERAYTGYLNKLRVDVFKQIAQKFIKEGMDPKKDAGAFRSLAKFVNNASGRGDLGALSSSAQALNTVFFSPRLIASRFNMLNPVWYAKQHPAVRKEAIKSMAEFVGVGVTVLAMAKAGGADVEVDPRSTDFGKIKVGNTRWDIWGGFQQWARVIAQIGSGYRKTGKGDVMKLSADEFPYDTRYDVGRRFLEGKAAPIPALALELLRGQKLHGEELTVSGTALNHLIPLYLQDMKESVNELGPEALFTVGVPGFFGVGTQSYVERPAQGAIHSTIAPHLRSTTEDAIMDAKAHIGPVARKETESPAEYRLRQELYAKYIDREIASAVKQASYAGKSLDKKQEAVEAAALRGRGIARSNTLRTYKTPQEATADLQRKIAEISRQVR